MWWIYLHTLILNLCLFSFIIVYGVHYLRFDSGKPNFNMGWCLDSRNGYQWILSWIEIINKTSLHLPLGTEWVCLLLQGCVMFQVSISLFLSGYLSTGRSIYTNGKDDSTFLFSWLLSISVPLIAWTVSPLHWFGGTPLQEKKKKGICNYVFSLHSSWSEVLVLGLHNQEFMLKE